MKDIKSEIYGIEVNIKAMKRLQRNLLNEVGTNYCPLCRANTVCHTCPWVVITGSVCSDRKGVTAVRMYPEDCPFKASQRAGELAEWIEIYEEKLRELSDEQS